MRPVFTLALCLLLTPLSLSAQDDDFPLARPPPVQHTDDIVPQSASDIAPGTGVAPAKTTGFIPEGEAPEPQVRIIDRGDRMIEEYRVNGKLYMVRIIPRIGIPYYLIDTDGDGAYDMRTTDLDSMAVPMWVIYSW